MSTEFRTSTTDELAFVRFFGGTDRGACFEFGSVSNWERVREAAANGETFVPEFGQGSLDSDPEFTPEGFDEVVRSGRATFGEFPVTVALGSGDAFNFTTEF